MGERSLKESLVCPRWSGKGQVPLTAAVNGPSPRLLGETSFIITGEARGQHGNGEGGRGTCGSPLRKKNNTGVLLTNSPNFKGSLGGFFGVY